MHYTEEISMSKAKGLLIKCGLNVPEGVDYTAGVFDDAHGLVATGSLKGDMIQGIAVDPAHQGEDLMGKLMTHLIGEAGCRGMNSLHLFTKPEKAVQFMGLGFRTVATARPYAALLEWGDNGIKKYQEYLGRNKYDIDGKIAAIVMNCNPFTMGHRYLVEQAASAADYLYIIVVEEDKSLFSFKDRLEMVKRGTEDINNITVLGGGRYAVSSLTFPSYFTKEEKLAYAHTAMDAELFAKCIAPMLDVNVRFIGTEPHSAVTAIYNETLKERLPKAGIEVVEIERCKFEGEPVSASRVRQKLEEMASKAKEGNSSLFSWIDEASFNGILPKTTIEYIRQPDMQDYLYEVFNGNE